MKIVHDTCIATDGNGFVFFHVIENDTTKKGYHRLGEYKTLECLYADFPQCEGMDVQYTAPWNNH